MTRSTAAWRWRHPLLRRLLRPANRPALDRWVAERGRALDGLVLNLGAGQDRAPYGRRVIRVDAYSPDTDVRADVAHALPFGDSTFDAAICTEVLEHVGDPRQVLRELGRVLRPGGAALISVPFVFQYHGDPEDYVRFTPAGLRTELERAGFVVELCGGLGTRLTTVLLVAETSFVPIKAAVRLVVLALAPLLAREPVRESRRARWAANTVAVARRG